MATPSVEKHLDVLEKIGSGFVRIAVADQDDAFPLEDPEEVFHDGIVVEIAGTVHQAVDAVPDLLVAEIIV